MKKTSGSVLVMVLCSGLAWAQGEQKILAKLGSPQTIVYNAKIVTVEDASFSSNLGTIAQAMAIRDGKVLAAGSNDEIRALAGPQTRLTDLKGRTVVPGFIAVHNHPQDWAPVVPQIMQKVVPESLMVNRFLTGPPREQIEKFPQVLDEAVKAARPGVWIQIVFFWDITVSPEDPYIRWAGTRITKEQLDRAAPNHPLLVRSRPAILAQDISGMFNQKAIDVFRKEGPPDFMKDYDQLAREEKTGVLGGLIYRTLIPEVIFKNHLDLYTEMMRLDLSWWAGLGQTTFGTFLYHYPNVLKAFRLLDRRGQMDNRLAWGWGELPQAAWERDFEDPFLVADLATREGTGTDYMWYMGTGEVGGPCTSMEPLPSRPKGTRLVLPGGGCEGEYHPGGAVWNALYKVVKEGGRVIGSHQWGDVDINNILNLIEQASKEGGLTPEEIRARRHTADHMQGWPWPDQIPRIKELGMILGGTNLFIFQDSPRWLRDYGEKALDMVVPRRSLVEAGIMSGIELDKPYEVTDKNVFTYLSWSIHRRAQDGKVYAPRQRISREVALKTATIWPAHYVLKEDVLGSLEPGKFADFLVLDKDYLRVPEDEIANVRVLMTVVGGKVVHLVPSLAKELGMQPTGAAVELGGPAAKY
ncbi:MAG: amidohydrolase family protein [Acidobacteria bacterium]|nr:amidohydrolase family protein [Acidobacteriota bacterium]